MEDNFLNKIRDRHNTILNLVLFALCAIAIVLLYPREARFKYEFEAGKTWVHEDLTAPFDFAIRKTDAELDSSRSVARSSVPPVYEVDPDVEGKARRQFREELTNSWSESSRSDEGAGAVRDLFINDRQDSLNLEKHLKAGVEILGDLYERGIVNLESVHREAGRTRITLVEENVAKEVTLDVLYSLAEANEAMADMVRDRAGLDDDFISDRLSESLRYNVLYNPHRTELLIEEAVNEVSAFSGKRRGGELLISRGEVVGEEDYRVLSSLKTAYEKRLGGEESLFFIRTGQFLLVLLCMLAMALFLGMFYPEALALPSRVVFLLVLILLVTIMAKFALEVDFLHIYLAPVCILPIIVRAFYDARMALFMHVVVVFVIAFIVPNPFEFAFLQVFAGILLLYGIRNLRSRSQFFNNAFVIFSSYGVTYFGLNLLQEGTLEGINWMNFAWFGGNALLSLMAYPLIYMFEKLFGFMSEVTLLELSDSNHPLLRQLNEKTPGTFQHTLQVANLAEEAIREIGGDAMLVRAGAMYHDIGKMYQPEFFIENQQSGMNPHDDLDPEESSRIIIDHVIRGIEMAKKQGLPDVIIDFIRTHHGTTRTEYFYRKALEEDPQTDPEIYTYPGPRPFSKETAVLMMADAVEAASRSLSKPTHEKLQSLINSIIEHQISLDQFDNSNITFRNVEEVKAVFLKKLMSIYHVRVEYPEKA